MNPIRESASQLKPEVPQIQVPSTLQPFLDYWNSKELPKCLDNKVSRNTLIDALKKLRKFRSGTLYNNIPELEKFHNIKGDLEDFRIAVDNFCIARNDLTYYPKDKTYIKTINLSRFLLEKIGPYTKVISYFIKYIEQDASPIQLEKRLLKDSSPELTKKIIPVYQEFFQKPLQDESLLILAKGKVVNLFSKFEKQNRLNVRLTPFEQVNKLFSMFEATGWRPNPDQISSDWMMEKFEAFLKETGYVK